MSTDPQSKAANVNDPKSQVNVVPRPSDAAESEPALVAPPPPSAGSRLKVVTIARGTAPSFSDGEIPPAARHDPYLGAVIDGRYKVEAVLGEGGMGVVYRCRHTIIGKKVAMKVLRADLARDAEVTERFLNEARAASAIGNSHIIDISDFGQFADGSTYFVMEYLEGQPLSALLEGGGPMPISRIIHLGRQLAEGLAAAHRAGIVHRDLKPDNIFLIDRGADKDFIKILDFGIAKVVGGASTNKLTRAGAVFGTPHYMSPEQAAGQPVDHRVDVYALGVILYEMASGRVPFDADNFMGILTQHMYKSPVPIRALIPAPQEIPPGLEAIVLKCLSKRPEHRYQSMVDIADELDKLKAGMIPEAVPELMARSGSFNVPVDYFQKAAMPVPVPGMPDEVPMGSRGPLYVALGSGALLLILGVAWALGRGSVASNRSLPQAPAPAASALGVFAPSSAPSSPSPRVEVMREKSVAIAVEPLDAHVFRGDQDLGPSPVMIDIDPANPIIVTIKKTGYKDTAVMLDGTEPKQSIKLERIPPKGPVWVPPVKPKTDASSRIGGGELVDPWGNRR